MFQQFKLWKIRRASQKKLSKNYMLLYKNMSAYIKNSTLSSYEIEVVLNEILDILLESQHEGRDIADINRIIGDDYEVFCQSIIDEYNHDKPIVYRVMKYFNKGFFLSMCLILVFGIINSALQASIIPELDGNDIITGLVWGFVFMPYVLKRFRRMPNIYNKNDMIILFTTGALVVALPESVKWVMGERFLKYTVTIFDGIPYLLAGILLVVIFEAIERVYELRLGKNS